MSMRSPNVVMARARSSGMEMWNCSSMANRIVSESSESIPAAAERTDPIDRRRSTSADDRTCKRPARLRSRARGKGAGGGGWEGGEVGGADGSSATYESEKCRDHRVAGEGWRVAGDSRGG